MISVIIPNYNYSRYLKKRLDSIIKQTRKPDEIIFLDDCSSDNSTEIAEKILSKSGIPYQVITGKKNSGSVFRQWQKGIDLAKGDFIWIAEADDSCSRRFLEKTETVIKADSRTGLCYTESYVINQNHYISDKTFFKRIHNYIDPDKWQKDYTEKGKTEVCNYLFIRNTIPNASAVLFRRKALVSAGPVPQEYILSGDWLIYIKILEKWKISYIAEALNYNRFHTKRITENYSSTKLQIREALEIAEHCLTNFDIPQKSREEFVLNLLFLIRRSRNRITLDQNLLQKLKALLGPDVVEKAMMRSINTYNRKFADSRNSIFQRMDRLTAQKLLYKLIKRKV